MFSVLIKENKKSQTNSGRAASPLLTAENNYATKSHWLQWDVPHLPLPSKKLPLSLRRSPSHLIHPSSTDSTHHRKRHPDPDNSFATVHFPDRHTDIHVPTDSLGDRSIPRAASYA